MCAATMDHQPPPLAEDVELRRVWDALLASGWEARLQRAWLLGDEEVRLRVGPDEDRYVELLGR